MRTSEECVVTEVGSRGCFQKGVTADRVNVSQGRPETLHGLKSDEVPGENN